MAEAFSRFRAKLVRNKGPWRSIDDLEISVAEYIHWFNHRRLHGEIGLVPPVEFGKPAIRCDHRHGNGRTSTIEPPLNPGRDRAWLRPTVDGQVRAGRDRVQYLDRPAVAPHRQRGLFR